MVVRFPFHRSATLPRATAALRTTLACITFTHGQYDCYEAFSASHQICISDHRRTPRTMREDPLDRAGTNSRRRFARHPQGGAERDTQLSEVPPNAARCFAVSMTEVEELLTPYLYRTLRKIQLLISRLVNSQAQIVSRWRWPVSASCPIRSIGSATDNEARRREGSVSA
jgi:hypothetical protein